MMADWAREEYLPRQNMKRPHPRTFHAEEPTEFTRAARAEAAQNALAHMYDTKDSYVQDRAQALQGSRHRMGGLLVRTKEDREAANKLLHDREAFFRKQEALPPPPEYRTPALTVLEGHIDDTSDALFSEIASGVITANTLTLATALRSTILTNGATLPLQKLVDVLRNVDGALMDVHSMPPLDSKVKMTLDAVLKSLDKTRTILTQLISLHQRGVSHQAMDTVVRTLRSEQAQESRNRLRDFGTITQARIRDMDARRAARSTVFGAPGHTESSSSFDWGEPGDDDDDGGDDGGEGDGPGAAGEDDGDDGEDDGEDGEDEGGDDGEGAALLPAFRSSPVAYNMPASPLFAATRASPLAYVGQPRTPGALSALPSLGRVERAEPRARGAWWRESLPLLNWLAPPPAASPATAVTRLTRYEPQADQRGSVAAPYLSPLHGRTAREVRPSPLAAAAQAAPQQLSSADRRRLAAELAQRHEALEAMPYAPSAESIAAYNKRTRATKWNSFQSRNAGKGYTMEELRRRYNLIEAAARL
jgi:hypothetical protein